MSLVLLRIPMAWYCPMFWMSSSSLQALVWIVDLVSLLLEHLDGALRDVLEQEDTDVTRVEGRQETRRREWNRL